MPKTKKAEPDAETFPRDRIVELRRVAARELLPNPKNWRGHPDGQRSALRGLLKEVGIADALIAYKSERADGSLVLIDGHLRRDEGPDTKWPVLLLDLTDDEAEKVLATLDPLASLATTNVDVLTELLHGIEAQQPELEELLREIAQDVGIDPPGFEPVDVDQQSRLDRKKKAKCPECGHEFTP